ncbi:DUF2231 domain-containing protein [Spirosoma gilvum]
MESRIKLAHHPAHQILIVFPFGLLATSAIFDLVFLLTGRPTMATVSYWMIVSGIIGGVLAAVPGFIDWMAIPSGTRAKRIGAIHGLGNVVVLLLFALSWFLRQDEISNLPPRGALVASFMGFSLAGVTGWLGGELVDRLGVGIDDGAHLDAPSSFSKQPANDVQSHTILSRRVQG